MKKYIIILLLQAICFNAQAQAVLSGAVKNARTGELLNGANVTLHNRDSDNIIAYSICNSKGEYSIKIDEQSDSLDLRVAYLGYAEQKIRIAPQSQTNNFSLDEKEFVLKESKITAPKIRAYGDTLSYNATQFTREQDRVLTDILDRMPGVEVNKETGGIKYQGTPINRFYVENQNLMDGRYGEISKNLPVDAVKGVEIMEHHQPVRALQDISFSEQAAMNIKLTDKAKGKWIGNGFTAGLGLSPLLWQAEFSAMRFSPDLQTYVTYKTNNTGQDVKIYNNFASIQIIMLNETNTGAFYSPFISSPDIDKKRSFFNRSHAFSINNLWKTGKESNIRFNIDYRNEDTEQESAQTTKYFLNGDSVYTYSEKYAVNNYQNKLNGNLIYTKNDARLFLENKLSAEADWQKINSTISNGDSINQRFRLPSFEVSDEFRTIIRTGKKQTYNLSSNNSFKLQPQELRTNISPTAGSIADISQIADIKTFTSKNSLAFGHSIKKVNLYYMTVYDFKIDDYNAGNAIFRRREHKIDFSPSVSYQDGRLRTNIYLPLYYMNFASSDNICDFSGFVFEPSIRVQYSFNYFWEMSASGNLSSDFGSIYDVASEVMKNYRTQYVFAGALPRTNTAAAGLGISYKNPIKALFAYANVSYSNIRGNNTSEQTINGAQIINRVIEGKNKTESINANGYLSKIFDWQRCSAKLNWSISQSRSQQIQNTVLMPFSNFSFSVSPSFNIETVAEQMLSYSLTLSAVRSTVQNVRQPFMRNLKQNFTYYIPITKKINLMIIGEHLRNQVSAGQHVNMFLMDAVARYKVSPKFELTLSCNNILDTREYSYSSYTDLYYTSYSYKLRPMNVMFTANVKMR
ncbi:MAG: carboxypeptidase-like regulatory domain-containing protein [Prevotellaceae bacterium]|nr:carboxypeptidase-like regulatory domain-containing protein [Prevotellaceae bacterium]